MNKYDKCGISYNGLNGRWTGFVSWRDRGMYRDAHSEPLPTESSR